MEAIIRRANIEDIKRLEEFLEEAKLSKDGVESCVEYFLIMENQMGDIKATLGIEPLGEIGLLRSLAIRQGVDEIEKSLFMLIEQILILAKDKQLQALYLASNKKNSSDFFRLMGFIEEEIENLPKVLCQSDHVKHILTVDNSFFLKLSI
ncbi:amino-acid N-acetyltransferase [Cytobacillus eiseniae]|uniref:Amino-acid N-acetyltransferase n=1 Tax=Cytobacillus eiseniae TaxID=762947 RepID=A0ABS4RKD7_9BACI|nr:hypothetical protein [Cytobacillus eiseniae]MBP2243361.1 amino-acid N-acetyltransferase [Cytobacillus eiseniae]